MRPYRQVWVSQRWKVGWELQVGASVSNAGRPLINEVQIIPLHLTSGLCWHIYNIQEGLKGKAVGHMFMLTL